MIIDANMYWLPEELFSDPVLLEKFLSEIPRMYGIKGYSMRDESNGKVQIVLEKPEGFQNLNYLQGEYRLEQQLADMDSAGVDKAVLKLPGCHEWMGLDMCRLFNTKMALHCEKSGHRLRQLAVVPPAGTNGCISELRRCVKEYGVTGVQMCSHYGGLYLDHECFTPYFKELNTMHATVYIHHTPVPVEYGSLYEYNNLRRSYGRCADQMTVLSRLLFSSFFEKFPNLRCVFSMLGGGFFAYKGLMLPHAASKSDTVKRFESDSLDIIRVLEKNIFFEMSHAQPWGKTQLECAVSVLGADKIIFGSSYPVRNEWLTGGPAFVEALNISSEDKEKILYKNAESLY